ncbi:MAG: hypothetical protein MUF41_03580 [Sphingopyxis sp.]|nr:hypothetical protein [Sphingopyxis sp.]
MAQGTGSLALQWFRALGGERLRLSFRARRDISVDIVECPALALDPAGAERLIADCRHVVAACLNGAQLDYGLFAPDGRAWETSIITLIRRRADNVPIAFNAMPLLDVERGGTQETVLHLGLVMVDPAERSGGLSWILYGLTCFLLFVRRRLRPLWVSSVTQVPAVVGMVADTFDQVYPGQTGTAPGFAHRHLAHQIMARHRAAFGVGGDATFNADAQIIENAYTGGSDNLKKSFAVATKHRNPIYNDWCERHLDYVRGDDVLQIGRIDLKTTRRFVVESVPGGAIPRLVVQMLVVGVQAIAAPLAQWLDSHHPLGRLRAVS